MAQIKLAEFTFDNSVGDVTLTLTPNTITMTTEDAVNGSITRRIVYIDNATMPTRIMFSVREPLLTVDYLNIDSNITSMQQLFHNAKSLTYINVDNWNTSNVTGLNQCFYMTNTLTQNIDFTKMNLSKVTGWHMAFAYSSFPRIDLSHISPTISGGDKELFGYCKAEYINISGWTFTNTMSQLFNNAEQLKTVVLDNVTTTGVTDMGTMFRNCYNLKTINVSSFDTSSVTSFADMFNNCGIVTEIKGVKNFNVSSATNFAAMFRGCSSLTKLDLRNWVTSSATNFASMFNGCTNLEILRVDNFDYKEKDGGGTVLNSMFENCAKLKQIFLPKLTNKGLGNFNRFCHGCSSLEYISMPNFVWGNCTSMNGTFNGCTSLKMLDLTTLDSSTFYNKAYGISGIIGWNMTCPVYYNSNTCSSTDFTDIPNRTNLIDVQGRLMAVYDFNNSVTTSDSAYPTLTGSTVTKTIDTQGSESYITHRVISVDTMPTAISFQPVTGLLNVDYLAVTSSCTSLQSLFDNCIRLENINTFGWDTQNVTTLYACFQNCGLTNIDLQYFNTSKVTDMGYLFKGSAIQQLDMSSFDTSSCTSFNRLCEDCTSLTTVKFGNLNTTKVKSMTRMFASCSNLTGEIDMTSFNTKAVTDGTFMFSSASSNIVVYVHDTNWTISEESAGYYNATFVRRLSTLLAKYTFDNSIGDCLPTITGITTSDYKVSDIVNDTITTRLLSTDSDKTITQYVFSASAIANNKSLLTLDYLKIDNNITSLHNLLQNCDKLVSVNAENWDTSSVTSMGYFLQACGSLIEVKGLGSFNTSKVTNLSGALQVHKLTNIQEISNWDISNCTNFAYLFSTSTLTGELDLSNWSPAKAENMQNMFALTNLTSINLSGWDVPKLNSMTNMFAGHNTNSLISVNMSNWTMETPANMNSMFYNNPNLTSIDFTGSKIVSGSLSQAFQSCSKLTSLDVSGFDTSQCENINVIFADCAKLTEINGLENWDVSKVVNMNQVFSNCTVLANLDDISNWDTSEARYMYGIFSGCRSLTSLNVNSWDVGKATTLQGCFSDLAMDSLDLSNWNVSQVSNFGFLFSGTKIKNINVSGWDTSAGTNFQYLFTSATTFEEVDLSSWKVSSDANLYLAFNGCLTNQTIYYDPLLWQGSRQENITWTVRPSKNNGYWLDMTGITGATEITLFNENNLPTEDILTDWGDGTQNSELTHTYSTASEYVVVSNLQNAKSSGNLKDYITKMVVFYASTPANLCFNYNKITEVTLTNNWAEKTIEKYGQKVSMTQMFRNCPLLELPNLELIKQFKPTYCVGMFYNCQKFTSIDLTGWDLSNCTSMELMFSGCTNLTEIKGIENLNVSNCTSMTSMFNSCSSLTSLDLSSWNTSKVTTINKMFWKCTSLIDCSFIESWDFSSMDNMLDAFAYSGIKTFNFRNKTLNKLQYCATMLAYNTSLESVDFSGTTMTYNGGGIGNPAGIFDGCTNLKTAKFDNMTFIPKNCNIMFRNCSSLTSLDLSSWDTSQCTNLKEMFSGCSELTIVKLDNWNTSKVTDMDGLFRQCSVLKNIDLSSFTTESKPYMPRIFMDVPIRMIDLSNIIYYDGMDMGMFRWNSGTTEDIIFGMLYTDATTINKLVEAYFNGDNGTNPVIIYYQDADPSQLTPVEGVTFKKYQIPSTIQLPPHIQLHSLPDGTRDEVDIKTGILTHNTGECTWNDSTVGWGVSISEGSTTFYHLGDWGEPNYGTIQQDMELPLEINGNNTIVISPNVIGVEVWGNAEARKMNIHVPMKFNNENEAKQWLKENQVTFIYRKETPTTEKLILNYNHSCDYGRILPTGMCDKYDVVNSMYTQTMTSILLDGENTWDAMEEMTNVVKFTATGTTVGVEELNMLGAGGLYCDNDLFPNINDDSDVEHCRVDEAGNKFYIYISKDRLMSPDLIGWQIWLQANPFNLIYELAEHLTYVKPYEELDPTQARWEGMDCMRDGAIKYHANNSDNLTMYPTLEYVAPSINNFEVTMLEPNTDYTIYAEGINKNDTINLGGNDINFNNGTVYTSGDNQWLRIDNNDSFYNMAITKGDTTGEHVPYFEGMASVENPKVRTPIVVNGLLSTAQGKWESNSNFGGSVVYVPMIDVKVGQKYIIASSSSILVAVWRSKTWVNDNVTQIEYADVLPDRPLIFTPDVSQVAIFMVVAKHLTDKAHEVELRMYEGEVDYGYLGRVENPKVIIERSTVSYTDLKLRSLPNGVKDTINVVTGEYVQRVGEIVVNSYNNNVIYQSDNLTETLYAQIFDVPNNMKVASPLQKSVMVCDKLQQQTDIQLIHQNFPETVIDKPAFIIFSNSVSIRYPKNWGTTPQQLNNHLKINPLTFMYELAEPITTKLDPQTLLAYTDGTIKLSSDTGLLPTTHYTVPSTNTFHLPSMKTGTRYTLKYPSASGSITIGDINYSISSDSMLFTTPLKINGDTSAIIFSDANPENVVLLEGAYNTREVPYFTGVKSVKNPNITIIDQLSTESTTYNCETEIELRGLPNGVADKLDIIKGKLTTNVGIRPYQEGDENLSNIWTDGYETVYALSSPVVTNVTIDQPTVTTNSLIELSSDYLIPQLNYRAPSSNNFPLDLLQSNTTYTLYADTLVSGNYTLGGTRTGIYSQPHTITLGDMTDNLLTFNGDLGLSNVMLVKGNSLKTTLPPYFLGIRSVTDGHLLVEGMAGEMNEITFDEGIVLRDCNGVKDTIDLITCTLTKRTGEITLTGAEGWYRADNESTTDHNVFKLTLGGLKEALVMCDTLQSVFDTKMMDCIHAHTNELCIVIANATIGGDTVNALKSWLNQHPTTVVYQLSTPIEVQLENTWTTTPPTSYDNQTEISSTVSTNSLKPMISVTIATTTLEEIVSDLEAQNAQLEEENMATMLALTSVYETLAAPATVSTMSLDDEVSTVNLSDGKDGNSVNGMSVSPIGMVYVNLIRKGLKTIEQVPYNLQPEVMYALRGME